MNSTKEETAPAPPSVSKLKVPIFAAGFIPCHTGGCYTFMLVAVSVNCNFQHNSLQTTTGISLKALTLKKRYAASRMLPAPWPGAVPRMLAAQRQRLKLQITRHGIPSIGLTLFHAGNFGPP